MNRKTLTRIYEIMGIYDIILAIPLLLFPSFAFNLFKVTESTNSPLLYVTASGLMAIGVLLVYYASSASSHKMIGYCSVFIRWHYAASVLTSLAQGYDLIFMIFAVTDLFTGAILLYALVKTE
ncbi:MAG: hypothetical protein ACXAE3_00970 [Candidatus Kariarchaeaceae archaeon]